MNKRMKEMSGFFFPPLNLCEMIATFPCMPGKALQVLVDRE